MYEMLPPALTAQKAWVNVSDGSKVPLQTGGTRLAASAIDPRTWGTFDSAVQNVERYRYTGVGYVFHDTGIVGIDIDDGFGEDGFLSPVAVDIISRCGSYCEKSRSGRGFHIFIRGELPFKGRNNRAGVEIYKDARYFIMTGKTMFFREIADNQDAINYVIEKYFPDPSIPNDDTVSDCIYTPLYPKPEGGKVFVKPKYPPIPQGCRHISLVSLAGQLHSQGYPASNIYRELLFANRAACKPPLDEYEIESIVKSIVKYRRKR